MYCRWEMGASWMCSLHPPLRSAMRSCPTGSFRCVRTLFRGLLSEWPSAASIEPEPGYRPLKASLMRARVLRFVLTILSDVQARAQSVGRILFGFYAVPDSSSVPIDFVINLEGNEERSKKRCSH